MPKTLTTDHECMTLRPQCTRAFRIEKSFITYFMTQRLHRKLQERFFVKN